MDKVRRIYAPIVLRMKKLYEGSSLFRFFFILLCVTLLFSLKYRFLGGFFMTNDDTDMMKTLSGDFTGKPESYHQFICLPLGVVFRFFYTWFPNVSWYSFFHVGSTILCVSVIIFVMTEEQRVKQGRMRWIGNVFSICLVSALLVYPFHIISWTITAALYAVAAIMLLITLRNSKADKRFFLIYSISLALMLMCELVRFSTFDSQLPFFILTFLFVLMKCRERIGRREKIILFVTTFALSALIMNLYRVDQYYKDHVVESQSFVELNQYRYLFSDHYVLPYEGNEEFYESLGWDKELYDVSRNWMYIDPRFNSENLKAIVETSENSQVENTLASKIHDAYVCFFTMGGNAKPDIVRRVVSVVIALLAVSGTAAFFVIWKKKKTVMMNLLYFSAVNWLGTMEIVYLCFFGRFLHRSFLCAAIPVLVIDIITFTKGLNWIMENAASAVENQQHSKVNSPMPKLVRFIAENGQGIVILCVAFSICAILLMMRLILNKGFRSIFDEGNTSVMAIEKYSIDHPENFYLNNDIITEDKSLFEDLKQLRGCRRNLMFWGGTGVYSKTFYDSIRNYGFSEFYSDKLLEDNVYFITTDDNFDESDFSLYMRKTYGENVHCTIIDVIDDAAFVYKFSKSS